MSKLYSKKGRGGGVQLGQHARTGGSRLHQLRVSNARLGGWTPSGGKCEVRF